MGSRTSDISRWVSLESCDVRSVELCVAGIFVGPGVERLGEAVASLFEV